MDRSQQTVFTARDGDASGDAWEWRVHADRLAPLIDGIEYFRAVRSAMTRARRQILILGWELHSEIDLVRGEAAEQIARQDGWPVRLADLLQALVEERPELEVQLLIWEGASLFAIERQFVPRMKRPWDRHPRLTLVWDRDTPPLGSHHQKLVVVDDRVAFAGGMDLTQSRWDTHAHRIGDERRRKPGLLPFHGDPYHDAMIALDGEAAATLGSWSRERWLRATGERLDAPEPPAAGVEGTDPWPEDVEPLLTDRVVSFALTQPDFGGRPEKRQCEQAFLVQIRAARRLIYIETQYLAASDVVEALCERLAEPDGPEVVLILPFGCPGTLQSLAMDTRRDELFAKLRAADRHDRFGVYWPTLAGGATEDVFDQSVYVHAKLMVVDDRILRVGSANLNERSMGLDTELDVFVEVADETDREAIARFRRRSLSYLLGVEAERLAAVEAEQGSLVATIDALRDGDRTLQPFDHAAPDRNGEHSLAIELADPSRPLDDVDVQTVLEAMAQSAGVVPRLRGVANEAIGVFRRSRGAFLSLAALLVVAVLIAFTPLRDWLDRSVLVDLLGSIGHGPMGLLGALGAFVLLGSLGFPITVLVAATGAAIGSWWAAAFAFVGVMGASVAGFFVGRRMPGLVGDDLAEGRFARIRRAVENDSVLAIAVIRNIPVAPFTVVNALIGLSGVRWGAYLLGTAIGMLPGTILLSVFGYELGDLLRDPSPRAIVGAAAAIVAIVAVSVLGQRWLGDLEEEGGGVTGDDRGRGDE